MSMIGIHQVVDCISEGTEWIIILLKDISLSIQIEHSGLVVLPPATGVEARGWMTNGDVSQAEKEQKP